MRNLSYKLYAELPPSVRLRLEGPTRASASGKGEAIGCFTLYNKKDTQVRLSTHILNADEALCLQDMSINVISKIFYFWSLSSRSALSQVSH